MRGTPTLHICIVVMVVVVKCLLYFAMNLIFYIVYQSPLEMLCTLCIRTWLYTLFELRERKRSNLFKHNSVFVWRNWVVYLSEWVIDNFFRAFSTIACDAYESEIFFLIIFLWYADIWRRVKLTLFYVKLLLNSSPTERIFNLIVTSR